QAVAQALSRMARAGNPVAACVAVPCRECGAVILRGKGDLRCNAPAYCLACLATHPEAPFGERVKAFRLARGMTPRQLGEAVGMSAQNVSVYERGRGPLKWVTLVKFARALGAELLTLGLGGKAPSGS